MFFLPCSCEVNVEYLSGKSETVCVRDIPFHSQRPQSEAFFDIFDVILKDYFPKKLWVNLESYTNL